MKCLVDGQWWLCCQCHSLEMVNSDSDENEDDDKVFIYDDVKDKFKIRSVTVLIKPVRSSKQNAGIA